MYIVMKCIELNNSEKNVKDMTEMIVGVVERPEVLWGSGRVANQWQGVVEVDADQVRWGSDGQQRVESSSPPV